MLELLARGREQEIALVALRLARAIERALSVRQPAAGDIMAGGQHARAELARGAQKIVELDRLVAVDAGHRGLAGGIALREAIDHRLLEAALVVEHVMGNADPLGDEARVVNVLSGAAGALAVRRLAMIVELQGHAHDVIALGLEQRRGHRGIHPARHGDDHAGGFRPTFQFQAVGHIGRGLPAEFH